MRPDNSINCRTCLIGPSFVLYTERQKLFDFSPDFKVNKYIFLKKAPSFLSPFIVFHVFKENNSSSFSLKFLYNSRPSFGDYLVRG